MAGKIKLNNADKQKFAFKGFSRKENFRSKRRFFLIVCEGEKTEPNYFESLKDSLPKGVLNVCAFKIDGTGHNTTSLVKEAKKLKKSWEKEIDRQIDRLWVVFDKDSFTAQSFNSAIQQCLHKVDMACAWTNEAFELWYLLHFNYYNTGMSRTQYQSKIEENFRSKGLVGYEYKKNSTEMYKILNQYGSQSNAIKNARNLEILYAGQSNFANQNPCTMVHKLVEELFGLEEEINLEKPDKNTPSTLAKKGKVLN
ncbi:MAG: RloB family protein [Prevotella sp.]|jgi:hypothetical protein|nr:RloB family protein [Prevotella sp.]